MKRKNIANIIAKVLDEEMEVILGDGRVDRCTVEEAIIKVTAKRALDPRSKLGMEATRFLTEYQYGKPVQPVAAMKEADDQFSKYTDEELLQMQERLMKGALNGSLSGAQTYPEKVVGREQASEIIQSLPESRRVEARKEKAAEECEEAPPQVLTQEELRETDDLLFGRW